MNFDPQKPFGTIRGTYDLHPTARYQQGPYFYDAHRRCLNADAVKETKPTIIETATAELRKKAAGAADEALMKMQKTKSAVDADATPAKKSAYTRASNAYKKAQAILEDLSE